MNGNCIRVFTIQSDDSIGVERLIQRSVSVEPGDKDGNPRIGLTGDDDLAVGLYGDGAGDVGICGAGISNADQHSADVHRANVLSRLPSVLKRISAISPLEAAPTSTILPSD